MKDVADIAAAVSGPYQLLPPLSPEGYADLRADIARHGVKVPVEYDEENNILDGHHRVAICRELGITDWPRFVRKNLSEDQKREHALSLNVNRRQLSQSEKKKAVQAWLKASPARSNRAIASVVGVDHKTVSAERKRLSDGGEIPHHDQVIGKDGIRQPVAKPMRTMFLPERANVRELKAVVKVIRTAEMRKSRETRLGLVAAISAHGRRVAGEMPRAAYPVIYADPPWQQEAYSDETGQDRGLKYPTMSLDEIKALCAGDKSPATSSAECHLWTPANRTHHGIEVLNAWGFEFTTCQVWDKIDIGMGRRVRDRHEMLLIGKRGKLSFSPLPGENPPSLYAERKTEHSRKPVWFAEQIERQFPGVRKLELFNRRESLREGDVRLNGFWDFWGFEAAGNVTDEVAHG